MSNATSDPATAWSNFSHRASFSVTPDSAAPPPRSGRPNAGKALPRKRPRSTRRAPTTLLNTDTTNFRAMVQQFTGVSSGSFPTSYDTAVGQSAISFGMQQPPEMRYEYRPPQEQEEMMRFSAMPGLEEGDEMLMMMPGFFMDGMAGGGEDVVLGRLAGDGGCGGYY